nr:F-box/LRR-repeat protein 6-like [Penaeus vannamei]
MILNVVPVIFIQYSNLFLYYVLIYSLFTQTANRASRVCRLWRKVATNNRLWHTVDLATGRIKPRYRNERKLLWILENRLSEVRDLNLGGWNDAVTPPILPRLVELCPELTSLNLSYCHKIHSENLHTHLSLCKKLERLDLTNVMASHKPTPRCAVGQQTLSDMALTMNTRLTHLTLANNTLSNVPGLVWRCLSESDHCQNLQILDLSNVLTIGRDCVRINIELLQKGCTKLRTLRLTNSNTRLSQTSMSVQASSPGFPELEELSLAVDGNLSVGMNDSELERILKNSHKLRLLDVRGCINITDSSLVRIPPWDLEHLFLAGSTSPKYYSDRLELVVRKWQHSLVELDLSWTANADSIDAALIAISEESDNKLRYLNMCGSSVTFQPIRQVLARCKHLETINLTSCRALPRGLKRFHEALQLISLRADIAKGKFDENPDQDDDD